MNKLVMCSLIAAGVAHVAGCTVTTNPPGGVCGDGVRDVGEACDDGNLADRDGCNSVCEQEAKITANWSFKDFGGPTTSCPAGFDTVAIYSAALDDAGNDIGAPLLGDLFTCSDLTGAAYVDPGLYRIFLTVETHNATQLWGDSASIVLDVTRVDKSVTYSLLNDGGYFHLSWGLVGANSGAPLSCSAAGADTVETITTAASDNSVLTDKFTCSDHSGWTSGFRAGSYTFTVDATLGNGGALGQVVTVPNTVMGTKNDQVNLGHFVLPIDGL